MSTNKLLTALTLLISGSIWPQQDVAAQWFWNEIPVPQDSIPVFAIAGEPFTPKHFLRSGQQWVFFKTHLPCQSLAVSQGGQTTILSRNAATGGYAWMTPPTSPGVSLYPVSLYFDCSNVGATWSFNYSLDLIVVPPAQRAFTDGQVISTVIDPNLTQYRKNTILLWQGGSASMDKPLLVVEGIDATNESTVPPASRCQPRDSSVRHYRRLT